MKENKLMWITALFVAIVAWLFLTQPAYEKQVDALAERIKDHSAQVEELQKDVDKLDAQWEKY